MAKISLQITTFLLVLSIPKPNFSATTRLRFLASCEPYDTLKSDKTLKCDAPDVCCKAGGVYDLYNCSPPLMTSTPAIMTENNFTDPADTGDPPSCIENGDMVHIDYPGTGATEKVVALSTGWYSNKKLCKRQIKITALKTGKSTTAMVIDECASDAGCDQKHANQQPCRNNIVDASPSVWKALALDPDIGEAKITWSLL
ncbi:Ripening-related protein grip22 [Rhynchospora pubera]|uniref:Ripening-related protein grip22 n=1 Tax=Rhynchospora pubera TaxID=906938 RepID=A0AAV8GQL7_9POAL|nr:Ripening-related protein grip22 [Rhynchospora pubera]